MGGKEVRGVGGVGRGGGGWGVLLVDAESIGKAISYK